MIVSPIDSPDEWTLTAEARTLPAESRYPGRRVLGVRCMAATSRTVLAPVRSVARAYEGGELLEVEPVPFSILDVLDRLRMGLPELYFWLDGDTFSPPDAILDAGEVLVTTTAIWLGVVGQDGLVRDPSTWLSEMRAAWDGAGEDVSGWQEFEARVGAEIAGGSQRPVILTDHAGAPLTGRRVRITLSEGTASGDYEVDLNLEHDGDLQQAVSTAGLGIGSVFAGGASHAMLQLVPAGTGGDAPADQWAHYGGTPSATADSATASETLRLFSVTDLHNWFGPQHVSPDSGSAFGPGLARFRRNSRITPLVNGYETFADMIATLRSVQASGGSANFAGWDLHHLFQLLPASARTRFGLPADADLSLHALASDVVAAGGSARFLVNRFFNLDDSPLGPTATLVILLVFGIALHQLQDSPAFETMRGRELGILVGLIGWLGASVAINLLLQSDLELLEPSKGARDDLDALEGATALWSHYPVKRSDNPIAGSLTGALADFAGANHVGVYHQKMLVALRDNDVVGYLGGVDLNPNRRDDEHHAVESPYHDVHARLEGPVAEDLFHTFRQRWRHDSGQETAMADPPAQSAAGNHIVQVARTYFKPADSAHALPFAPAGDFTISDTLLRAIAKAQQFIYIEDQYFTPPESYLTVLLDALERIDKLIVVVPRTTDQPFGALHRQTALNELKVAGGDKVTLVTPVRRPHSATLSRIAGGGRFELREALPAVPAEHQEIALGPSARVPRSAPFWLAVEGEIMHVHQNVHLPLAASGDLAADGDTTSRFLVRRGNFLPGTIEVEPRSHEAGAPAMVISMDAIYVHSKLMIVDDVFLSMGSANLNERGLFYDGELNLFAMSDRMRADPASNVARALRIRLWAEQLGIPAQVAAPLLADPIAGSRLFDRPFFGGNRAVPPDFVGMDSALELTPGGSPIGDVLKLLGITLSATELDTFFYTIVDPTTDPSAQDD